MSEIHLLLPLAVPAAPRPRAQSPLVTCACWVFLLSPSLSLCLHLAPPHPFFTEQPNVLLKMEIRSYPNTSLTPHRLLIMLGIEFKLLCVTWKGLNCLSPVGQRTPFLVSHPPSLVTAPPAPGPPLAQPPPGAPLSQFCVVLPASEGPA